MTKTVELSTTSVDHINTDEKIKNQKGETKFDIISWIIFAFLVVITVLTYPSTNETQKVNIGQVWYYGWITAVSTGMGVIPFYFFSEPDKFWMGISNGIAGGMMVAASYSLGFEGATYVDDDDSTDNSLFRAGLGILSGVVFIIITKKILDKFDDFKLTGIDRVSAQKMILIVFVMTLHSLTEGIGIGVSFGGKRGMQLGQFISLSLAVHNIPEGLAVALVLTSRKVSRIRSGLWAVLTSLPQPLMAIPAFIFVENFEPFLPAGLGFAAGAMFYVAVFELMVEAVEDTSFVTTACTSSLAFMSMMFIQDLVKNSI